MVVLSRCSNKECDIGTVQGWDEELMKAFPEWVKDAFPVLMARKCTFDRRLMQERTTSYVEGVSTSCWRNIWARECVGEYVQVLRSYMRHAALYGYQQGAGDAALVLVVLDDGPRRAFWVFGPLRLQSTDATVGGDAQRGATHPARPPLQ